MIPKTDHEGKESGAEENLNRWFSVITGRGVYVSGPKLRSKSGELSKDLDHNNFKVTDSQLSQWKWRFGI
jgi:hypothetical protein